MSEHRKIETQTIWHEYGHLVGYEIAECLGQTFGEYEYASLIDEDRNPHIMRPSYDYVVIQHGTPEEGKKDLERVQKNLEDTERFFTYAIMLLSGSVFNIAYFNLYKGENLSTDQFNKCFKNYGEKILGCYTSRAGGDYDTYKKCCIRSTWNNKDIYKESDKFGLELYECYEKHKVFEELNLLIKDFDRKHNGTIVSRDDLNLEAIIISGYLTDKSVLVKDLQVIIEHMKEKVNSND